MPKPTIYSGWWKKLLDQKANGCVNDLAYTVGVTPRTLHRWQNNEIKFPSIEVRKQLQLLAGKELLKDPECPKYLDFGPKRKTK